MQQKHQAAITTMQTVLPKGLQVNASSPLHEVAKMDFPAISSLNRGKDSPDAGIALFEAFILDLSIYFGKEWEESKCYSVAQILFGEYHYWTFAELKHFFTKVKASHFGKIYGELTPFYLTEAALNYDVELLEVRKNQQKPKEFPITGKEVAKEELEKAFAVIEELKVEVKREKDEKEQEYQTRKKAYELKKLKQYCDTKGLDFETERKKFEI